MKYPLIITLTLALAAALMALDAKLKMAQLTARYRDDIEVSARVYRDLSHHVTWLIKKAGLKTAPNHSRITEP